MAQQLRLRSQKSPKKEEFGATVEVIVDNGLAHLSEPFTYAINRNQLNVEIGHLVSVSFGSKNLIGVVVGKSYEFKAGLKFVKKILHNRPVITSEQIEIIKKAQKRWSGDFWNYLKFAVPSIPSKKNIEEIKIEGVKRRIERPELRIGSSFFDLVELIKMRSNPSRQILIIVPELNLLQFLKKNIEGKCVEYGSHLEQSQRVENYLGILTGNANIILGTRSAIFLPLRNDAEILIVDDLSFEFYEKRFPYWNVRDLALIRSADHSITFYSHSPSLELVRLVEMNWLRMKQRKMERPNIFFNDGRVTDLATIKTGLRSGKVLVLVPEKGYVNALVCKNCRNIRICSKCGGRLVLSDSHEKPACSLCKERNQNEKCSFCNFSNFLMFRKGQERQIDELGKQIPGASIVKYQNLTTPIRSGQVCVATYGNYPLEKFSAVVCLGLEKFGYQNSLRSSELTRKVLFDIAALRANSFFLDIPSNDYFAQVINNGDPYKAALKELMERRTANLPPWYRIVYFQCDSKFVPTLEEQPFISAVHYEKGTALIKSKVEDSSDLVSFLQSISKYRSLRKLKPWNVKVDPLDI